MAKRKRVPILLLQPWGRCLLGECGFCGQVKAYLGLTRMCAWPRGSEGRVAFICGDCIELEHRMEAEQ